VVAATTGQMLTEPANRSRVEQVTRLVFSTLAAGTARCLLG